MVIARTFPRKNKRYKFNYDIFSKCKKQEVTKMAKKGKQKKLNEVKNDILPK